MKILLFEDEKKFSEPVVSYFKEKGCDVEVVNGMEGPPTCPHFQGLIKRAGEFDAVVWDAYMNGDTVKTTDGYVEAFAKVFKGPMIAFTRNPDLAFKQVAQGCCGKIKDKDPVKLWNEIQFHLEGR